MRHTHAIVKLRDAAIGDRKAGKEDKVDKGMDV